MKRLVLVTLSAAALGATLTTSPTVAQAAPPAPTGPELVSAPDEDVFAPRLSASRGAVFYEALGPDGRLIRQVPQKKKGALPAPGGGLAHRSPFWVGAKKAGANVLGTDGVWSLAVDGKPAVAASSAADLSGTPSPDGKWLAFVSGRSGQGDLYRVPADAKPGAAPERLSSGTFAELAPVWSPDSTQLLAIRLTERGRELVAFTGFGAGQSAREQVLVDDRLGVIAASFRPDGQAVAVVARSWASDTTLYTVPAGGGPTTSVLKGVRAEAPTWAPGKDKRWLLLAVTQRDAVVALDPLGGLQVVTTGAFGHGELVVSQTDRVLYFTALGLTAEATPRQYTRAGLYRMPLPANIE